MSGRHFSMGGGINLVAVAVIIIGAILLMRLFGRHFL